MKNTLSTSFILSLIFIAFFSIEGFAQAGLIASEKRQEAPDFTFKDADDNEVSLSDLKGKVVYMDLWGSWCKPCLKEMPNPKN